MFERQLASLESQLGEAKAAREKSDVALKGIRVRLQEMEAEQASLDERLMFALDDRDTVSRHMETMTEEAERSTREATDAHRETAFAREMVARVDARADAARDGRARRERCCASSFREARAARATTSALRASRFVPAGRPVVAPPSPRGFTRPLHASRSPPPPSAAPRPPGPSTDGRAFRNVGQPRAGHRLCESPSRTFPPLPPTARPRSADRLGAAGPRASGPEVDRRRRRTTRW